MSMMDDLIIQKSLAAVRAHDVQELAKLAKTLNGKLEGITSAASIPIDVVDFIRECFNSQAAVNHDESSYQMLKCATLLLGFVKSSIANASIHIYYIGKIAEFCKFLMRFHVRTLYYFIKSGNLNKICFVLRVFQGIAALGAGYAIELLERVDWKKMVRARCFKDGRIIHDAENGISDTGMPTPKATPRDEYICFVLELLQWDSKDIVELIQVNSILFRVFFNGLPIDEDEKVHKTLQSTHKLLFNGKCWLHCSQAERRKLILASYVQSLVMVMHKSHHTFDILKTIMASEREGLFNLHPEDVSSFLSTIDEISTYTMAIYRKLKCHKNSKHMEWMLMIADESPVLSMGFLIHARTPQSFNAGSEWIALVSIMSKLISKSNKGLALLLKSFISQRRLDGTSMRDFLTLCSKVLFPLSLNKSTLLASLHTDSMIALYHTLQLILELNEEFLTYYGMFSDQDDLKQMFNGNMKIKVANFMPDMRSYLAVYIHHRDAFIQAKTGSVDEKEKALVELVLFKILQCVRLCFKINNLMDICSDYDAFKLLSEDTFIFNKGHQVELFTFAYEVLANRAQQIELACSWKTISVIVRIALKAQDHEVRRSAEKLLKQILLHCHLFDAYTPELGIWFHYLRVSYQNRMSLDQTFLVDFFSQALHQAFSKVIDIVFLVDEVQRMNKSEIPSSDESTESYGPLVFLCLQQIFPFLKSDKRTQEQKMILAQYLCSVIKDILNINAASKLLKFTIVRIMDIASLQEHSQGQDENHWHILSNLYFEINEALAGRSPSTVFDAYNIRSEVEIGLLYEQTNLDHHALLVSKHMSVMSLHTFRSMLNTYTQVDHRQLLCTDWIRQTIERLRIDGLCSSCEVYVSIHSISLLHSAKSILNEMPDMQKSQICTCLIDACNALRCNVSDCNKSNPSEVANGSLSAESLQAIGRQTNIVLEVLLRCMQLLIELANDDQTSQKVCKIFEEVFAVDLTSTNLNGKYYAFLLDLVGTVTEYTASSTCIPQWLPLLHSNINKKMSHLCARGAPGIVKERFIRMCVKYIHQEKNLSCPSAGLHIDEAFLDAIVWDIGENEALILLYSVQNSPSIFNYFSNKLAKSDSIQRMTSLCFVRLVPIFIVFFSHALEIDGINFAIAQACLLKAISCLKEKGMDSRSLMVLGDLLNFFKESQLFFNLDDMNRGKSIFQNCPFAFEMIWESSIPHAAWEARTLASLRLMICFQKIISTSIYSVLISSFMRSVYQGEIFSRRKSKGIMSEDFKQILSYSMDIVGFHLMESGLVGNVAESNDILALASLCIKGMFESSILTESVVNFSNVLRKICTGFSLEESSVWLAHLSFNLLDLVLSHSAFLKSLTGKDANVAERSPQVYLTSILYNDQPSLQLDEANFNPKQKLCQILKNLIVIGMKHSLLKSDAIAQMHNLNSLVLSSYDGGSSAEGEAQLELIEILATKIGTPHLSEHYFLWGKAFRVYYSMPPGQRKDENAIKFIVHNIHMPSIDACRINHSIHWVLGEETKGSNRCGYNPFIMLKFVKLHASMCTLDFESAIKKGLISLCIACLASKSQALRNLAFETVLSCHNTISSYDFRNSKHFELLLGKMKQCVSDKKDRILTPTVALIAELAVCLSVPENKMYSVAYKLLTRDTTFDVDGIPVFLDILNTTFHNYKEHQKWLLNYLKLGIATDDDFGPYRRRFAFEILMAFAANPLTEPESVVLVFLLLEKASKITKFAEELLYKRNILIWLTNFILHLDPNAIQNEEEIVSIGLDIIKNLLKIASAQRWSVTALYSSSMQKLLDSIPKKTLHCSTVVASNINQIKSYLAE